MDDDIRCAACGAPAQAIGSSHGDGGPRPILCSSLLCPTNLAGSSDADRAAS